MWHRTKQHKSSSSVSIHTPTWGVTHYFLIFFAIVSSFNPHTYMRCDHVKFLFLCVCEVSIHTPTWGVTGGFHLFFRLGSFNPHTYMRCDIIIYILRAYFWSFNPHTYMRCDKRLSFILRNKKMFQSTHLHEVWPSPTTTPTGQSCFNPHTYMRCDVSAGYDVIILKVSIHTPTWGVTDSCPLLLLIFIVSIHTPTWGVTGVSFFFSDSF